MFNKCWYYSADIMYDDEHWERLVIKAKEIINESDSESDDKNDSESDDESDTQ
jgi:hypothetical protein